ncbi:MAG: hypothetical protein JSR44_12125 [Spirochaetes bacterium]|nr:hypothetical protein [Spirochaetota bacterium]
MATLVQIYLLIATVGAAIYLIHVLRRARNFNRSVRLETLELTAALKGTELGKILLAENAKLIARGIDQGALFLQGGHRVISDVTFGILQLLPATRKHAKIVEETYNFISTGIYGAFREINRHVGGNIAEKIKSAKPKAPIKKTKRVKPKRKLRSHSRS